MSILDQYRIDPETKEKLQKDAHRHLFKSYLNGLHQAIDHAGYPKRDISLTDKTVLTKISKKSKKTANEIERMYNRMLERYLEKLPDNMSEEQKKEKLKEFFDLVHSHNRKVLSPYLERWSNQQALKDFYAVNKIQTQWSVSPETSTAGSECEVALSMAPFSTETAAWFNFPAHRRCPHQLVPEKPKRLPPEENLWVGMESQTGRKYYI